MLSGGLCVLFVVYQLLCKDLYKDSWGPGSPQWTLGLREREERNKATVALGNQPDSNISIHQHDLSANANGSLLDPLNIKTIPIGHSNATSNKIVRLPISSNERDNCNFFYVRVPKTGSTSIHNILVQDKNARQQVCSVTAHIPIPKLDNKYHVGIFLVTVRDPYERFISQYRYSYQDIGQVGNWVEIFDLKTKYPCINDFVLGLDDVKPKLLKAAYWMSMTYYVPLKWMKKNRKRITFLCASSDSPPLHLQLEEALGVKLEHILPHHNPSEGMVHGVTANFTVLSEESREILAGSFLRSDLELYELSGCTMLSNNENSYFVNAGNAIARIIDELF